MTSCKPQGYVISAIANYTRCVTDAKLDSEQVGNPIHVKFDGKSPNLHTAWDSNISEELVRGWHLSDAQNWAQNLTATRLPDQGRLMDHQRQYFAFGAELVPRQQCAHNALL